MDKVSKGMQCYVSCVLTLLNNKIASKSTQFISGVPLRVKRPITEALLHLDG